MFFENLRGFTLEGSGVLLTGWVGPEGGVKFRLLEDIDCDAQLFRRQGDGKANPEFRVCFFWRRLGGVAILAAGRARWVVARWWWGLMVGGVLLVWHGFASLGLVAKRSSTIFDVEALAWMRLFARCWRWIFLAAGT